MTIQQDRQLHKCFEADPDWELKVSTADFGALKAKLSLHARHPFRVGDTIINFTDETAPYAFFNYIALAEPQFNLPTVSSIIEQCNKHDQLRVEHGNAVLTLSADRRQGTIKATRALMTGDELFDVRYDYHHLVAKALYDSMRGRDFLQSHVDAMKRLEVGNVKYHSAVLSSFGKQSWDDFLLGSSNQR